MLDASFPALTDLTVDGRARFVEEWGDRLWAYWDEQLSVLIAGWGDLPRVALGARWAGSEREASREIADRLLAALRGRPTLSKAKPWSDVEGWFTWLVGAAAMGAARRREEDSARDGGPGPDARSASSGDAPDPDPNPSADARRDEIQALVAEWSEVLVDVVVGTGIRAIEWDWLWATCKPRHLLATYLGKTGGRVMADTARWVEAKRRVLAKATSKPGAAVADRIGRTRAGAGACLRFNLQNWVSISEELAAAHRVFVGAAHPQPPYQPAAPVDPAALDGFRHAVRRAASARATAPLAGAAHLRAEVAHCAVRSAVLRLLPRQDRLQLEKEWDALTAGGRP